jgi:hypothetical protein
MGAERVRWPARSSKPLWGVTSLPGGFDSHAPSPPDLSRNHAEIGEFDIPAITEM